MSLQIPSVDQQESPVSVSEAVFDTPYNETLVHQLVTKYLSGARAGTKAQKNRSAVSGGGIKPFRQKGTGRARSGTSRSPIWRTGGATFAAQPRNYDQKLNKKMFKIGVKSIFSELLRQDRISISNDIYPATPKTKELATKLKALDAKKVLIIADKIDENLELASRNIPNLALTTAEYLSPVLLVSADKVLLTESALKQIEESLS